MSETIHRTFLFPGQGAYLPGVMAPFAPNPAVRDVLEQIDAAVPRPSGSRMVDLLLATAGRSIDELMTEDIAGLQLALFGTSVALFDLIADAVTPSDTLVGHSLGEIAALTAAGAFSIGDGARIVAARTAQLERTAPADGGMLAVSAGAEITSALVTAAGDPSVVVAVRNSPRQTVLSGPRTGLARIAAAAAALGIPTTALRAPFAFHHPALASTAEAFRVEIAGIRTRPLRHRVHSPILGRPYLLDDNLTDLLAQHLVRPVDLLTTIRELHEHDHNLFVECGARDTLVSAVRRTVPNVQTLNCLDGTRPGPELIASVCSRLTGAIGPQQDHSPVESDPVEVCSPGSTTEHTQIRITAEPAAATPNAITRTELLSRLRTAYAAALDYPESVITDDADLEADLGVDSVKQTELLARMGEAFGVDVAVGGIDMADLSTLNGVAAAIQERLPVGSNSPSGTCPSSESTTRSAPAQPAERSALLADLRSMYATTLDYPESVFTETADLEADLGIDSVKQTELLGRVTERFTGDSISRDIPMAELATLGAIVDFLVRQLGRRDRTELTGMTDDFAGRVVLVTGGAKGVGRAAVRAFARRGATLLINYFHSREAAEALRAELAADGATTALFRASVAKREQIDQMFDAIAAEFGGLDVLVNNAALGALRPLDQLDDRDWSRTFDTILKGSLWCSQRAAALMSSGGAIVNLSSLGSSMVLDSYTAIGTAKAALESLTRYLAVEYAPAGIRVNTASGGLIDGSVADLFPAAAELRSSIIAATPLGRLGTEAELAELVLFLASPSASWVTGQCLLADGGLSLGHAMLKAGSVSPAPAPTEPAPTASAPTAPAATASAPVGSVPTGSVPGEPARTHPAPAKTPAAPAKTPAAAEPDIEAGLGIAVVGIGIKVPGASDPESLFDLLLGDRPVFSEPGERFDIESFWAPADSGTPDSTYSRAFGFIHGENADAIPTTDYTTSWLRQCLKQALDGVHRRAGDRHLLAVGYTADGSQHLEEATVWEGIRHRLGAHVDRSDPATSAALQQLHGRLPHATDEPWLSFPHAVGAAAAADLLPPDTELVMLDTACSSSLYAVSTGISALRNGSCDIAVAGASFALGPRNSILFAGLHGLSEMDDVRSFDADADGVLFSDGAAVVVLKTLERARADNDNILGLLTGIGTSSDGRGKAVYAPNAQGQQIAVDRAWTSAGIGASDIDWVVAHATGTRAGDQVEIQTLKGALAGSTGLWVTSNKSVLGHTGWVAGIVSLIHVLQALDHQLIPGQRRFTAPPAAWQLESSPVQIPTADQPWRPVGHRPRTAAISSLGFGGTNAHAVVREYLPTARYAVRPLAPTDDPVVLVGWSAQLPGGLDRDSLRRWLSGDLVAAPDPSFGEEFPLPAVGTFRIPSGTLHTIDRCQVLAMQCVQDLDERLGNALDRHRLTTAVVAGHMGPTRNAVGYALRTYLRYVTDRIGAEDGLAPLRAALPRYAEQVHSLVPVTNEDASPGIMPNIIPARITNYFNFAGANLTVDTGFGSGLAAAGLAIDRIRDGDWDFGLVLGVNGNSTPEMRGLLGASLDGAVLAEGAVLLALTRRSLAERERLPVLAELDVLRDTDVDVQAASLPATDGRNYLGAQGTLELLAALDRASSTAVSCTDAITGAKTAVLIRPTGAAHPERATPERATPERAMPSEHGRARVDGPAPTTITPFAVEFQRCEVENVRSALPALPAQCLIITDAPDDLPPVDPTSLILSTVPAQHPGVMCVTGSISDTTVADAITDFGAPLRHLRVVVTLGADREHTEPGFDDALRLTDLTFLAARALRPAAAGGSCCLLALDAVQNARPRAVSGLFTGMIKTLQTELPETEVFALLTTASSAADGLAELAAESRKPRLLPVTVLDAGRRYVQLAVPRDEPHGPPGPIRIDRDSVVVAAGGSRGVAAALLTAIAQRSAPTIWLLGSNTLDGPGGDEPRQSRAEFLAAARAAGSGRTMAELNRAFDRLAHAREARTTISELTRICGPDAVRYRVCDLTDPDAVSRTITEIIAASGRVDLMIFGAGINRTAALDRKRLSDFRAVRDVKALGYAHLRRAFAGRPPAAWCNLGSILGFTGQPGEIDYTAGNDLLATAASAGRDDGCDEFTIGWTLWDSIGLAADPITSGFLHRSGFSAGMSTAEGVSLFLGELDRPARDRSTVHLGAAEKSMLEQRFPGMRAAMADAAAHPEPEHAQIDTDELPAAIGRRAFSASRRTFDAGERVTDCVLDLTHDTYLLDHLVDDRPTLPGTFAMELAATAAEDLCPGLRTIAFERVVFSKFVRLHPRRKSIDLRVRAAAQPPAPHSAARVVRVTITSDVRAPTGELLIADQVHAQLDVLLADRAVGGPVAPIQALDQGWPTVDPYLVRNPAVALSGPMDTLRSPVRSEHAGQAMFVLRSDAYRAPFDRFRIPALLLDGLARTSVLIGGDRTARPLVALSSIDRVDLFEADACGRNDIALAKRHPRIRLIARPDPATVGAFAADAIADSGVVLARMSGLVGVLLGWCEEDDGSYRAAERGRADWLDGPGSTRSADHLVTPILAAIAPHE